MSVTVGVLALQGDFREHIAMLETIGAGASVRPEGSDAASVGSDDGHAGVGAPAVEEGRPASVRPEGPKSPRVGSKHIRSIEDLEGIDALIIPGGESTTIGRLARIYGLIEPLRERIREGMPVLGTCAGMIFLASGTTGADQPQLEVLDVVVERNAFGRQVDSFEADLPIAGAPQPVHAVFIRAPWIEKLGSDVEVLTTVVDPRTGDERAVFVRQGNVLATSFHPELTGDTRIHEMLIDIARER